MSDNHEVHIFDMNNIDKKTGRPGYACAAKKAGDRVAVKAIDVVPGTTNFLSAGVGNHLYSWSFSAGGTMAPKRVGGMKASSAKVIFSTIKHSAKTKLAFVSCSNGTVCVVNGGTVTNQAKLHDKAVYCVNVVSEMGEEILLSGSADHTIKLHTVVSATQLTPKKTFNVGATAIPRSLDMMTNAQLGTKILCGLNNGCI